MTTRKSSGPGHINIFVRPGSKAELACRRYAAGEKMQPKEAAPRAEVITLGFSPRKSLNLCLMQQNDPDALFRKNLDLAF
jgi:hypothetical protein